MFTSHIKAVAKYNMEQGTTTKIDEVDWDALTSEFNIHCAESGRDREACFGTDYDEELYEYVTDVLETDNWEVV